MICRRPRRELDRPAACQAKLQAKVSRARATEREHESYFDITLVEAPHLLQTKTRPDDDPDFVRISKADLDRLTAAATSLTAAAKSINRRGR
jgi:hypothetical protein